MSTHSGAANELRNQGASIRGIRGSYLAGLATCTQVMFDLAMEVLGKGEPVSYPRCVEASTGHPPEKSNPENKPLKVAELLNRAGYAVNGEATLLKAVDAWRSDRLVPMASVRALGNAVYLALLQDDAKNQSSYLTWAEGAPQNEVARILRRDYLVTAERADKFSGAWGKHPLLGRIYLPAYRSGTEHVAEFRRSFRAKPVLPALYGCRGLVDIETVREVITAAQTS